MNGCLSLHGSPVMKSQKCVKKLKKTVSDTGPECADPGSLDLMESLVGLYILILIEDS